MQELIALYRGLDPRLALLTNLAFVLVLVVVVATLLRRVLGRLAARAGTTTNLWDSALVYAVSGPVGALVWASGLLTMLLLLRRHFAWEFAVSVRELGGVAAILLLAWAALRLTRGLERGLVETHASRGESFDVTTVDAVGKLARVVIMVLAGLAVLQTFGVGITGILAAGGVGGIAVGFAAKDLLANLFGGLTIYLDRPFAVGDWIRTLDGQIEGRVEYIGWRSTVVRTFERRPIYIPNALFTTLAVENPARMSHRRIREWVGVRYEDMEKVPALVEDLRLRLAALPELTREDQSVHLDRFGPSSVDLLVVCYTPRIEFDDYQAVRQRVLLTVAAAIAAAGAEIAFPTQVVHVAHAARAPTD